MALKWVVLGYAAGAEAMVLHLTLPGIDRLRKGLIEEELKNGGSELHPLSMISLQRLGFQENQEMLNRDRVGVTDIAPVRLLFDTLKIVREVWFRGGTVPLKRFESSCR
ncbi:ABC transporter G family member 40 [Camellia lanceoleosa]|uniref:ABC transporter G family member 40 n=1 Tax=Camellia lanceoleosa TaxID=1840588 RepID=A0ACC0GUH7_9ERIC|nr:ABC transporter G family member 40 [Camellia lanceoleosa]